MQTLTCATVKHDFPAGTADTDYTFTVTGTLADGTSFSTSALSSAPTTTFNLAPGTYTGTVSKLGISSLPSVALTVTVPATVTLQVPDVAQPAVLI